MPRAPHNICMLHVSAMRLIVVHRNDTNDTHMVGFTPGPRGDQCMLNITFYVLSVSVMLMFVSQKQRDALSAKGLGMSQNRRDMQQCPLCEKW